MNPESESISPSFPADPRAPALILLGGGPASGKSHIAAQIARRISNAVLLDKDLLFAAWVDALLAANGHPSDRDCAVYWDQIRPLEYKSLEQLALAHLRLGKVVVVDAPLRPELDDPAWVRRLGQVCRDSGAELIAAWVEVTEQCARERMQKRGELRDQWKIANWAEFTRRQSYQAPRAAALILDNNDRQDPDSAATQILQKLSPNSSSRL